MPPVCMSANVIGGSESGPPVIRLPPPFLDTAPAMGSHRARGEQIAFAEREGESFAPSQFSPFLISSEKE